MNRPMRTIEVDTETAASLEALAVKRGISLSALLAGMAESETAQQDDERQIEELMRRSEAVDAGEPTVPHDDVVSWLKTWGTPLFRSWPGK